MLSIILKKDQFDVDVKDDVLTIKKLPPKPDNPGEPSENPTREYSAVETSTPQFQELKKNLEKLTNKPKPEDLKNSRGPISGEKKENTASPNTDNGSKQTSGGPRQSWVLQSSTPQTKAFDGENPNLTNSQKIDSDEKPLDRSDVPAPKSSEDDSKVFKVKDNPFVRGNTPNKKEPEIKKTVTSSREGVVTKKIVEERQVVTKHETTTSTTTATATSSVHKTATQRYSVAPTSNKVIESEVRRSSVTGSNSNTSKPLEKSITSSREPAKKPTASPSPSPAPKTDRSKSKPTQAPVTTGEKSKRGSVANGWHSLEYENGLYEGYVVANKRHGKGRYTWKDGNWYEGDWEDDLKHGTGKFVWTTGDSYEGEYNKDKRDGVGIKIYTNGDKYEVVLFHPGRMGQR